MVMNEQVSEMFWSASAEDLKRGDVHHAATDSLVCGRSFMKGVIYREEDTYYEAEKFISVRLGTEYQRQRNRKRA